MIPEMTNLRKAVRKKKGEIELKGGGKLGWQYNYGIIIIFLEHWVMM